jgi:hypothetical protein
MAQPPRGDSREVAVGFKSDVANTYVPWEGDPTEKAAYVSIKGTPSVSVASQTDFEGGPVTVGTSAVELTFSGTTVTIIIQSDPDNTGRVWVGKSNVTSAGANAMTQLEPGDGLELSLDDSSNAVYAVSDTASQNVFKMALL